MIPTTQASIPAYWIPAAVAVEQRTAYVWVFTQAASLALADGEYWAFSSFSSSDLLTFRPQQLNSFLFLLNTPTPPVYSLPPAPPRSQAALRRWLAFVICTDVRKQVRKVLQLTVTPHWVVHSYRRRSVASTKPAELVPDWSNRKGR